MGNNIKRFLLLIRKINSNLSAKIDNESYQRRVENLRIKNSLLRGDLENIKRESLICFLWQRETVKTHFEKAILSIGEKKYILTNRWKITNTQNLIYHDLIPKDLKTQEIVE